MKSALFGFAAIATLIAMPAFAADMAVKAPPAPVAPAANWTGCYIGANGGGGWGTDGSWIDTTGLSHGGQNFSGALGGGQIGCDYQASGPWVIGIAATGDWGRLSGSVVDPFNAAYTSNTRVTMLDTVTGRIGLAFGQALAYVDGGGAWSRTERYFTPEVCPGQVCSTVTNTAGGWVIGGGLEYLFLPNLSGKLEYDYANFGAVSFSPVTGPGSLSPFSVKQNISELLVGLNYRFGLLH